MPDLPTWAGLAPYILTGIKWAADKFGGEAVESVWNKGLGKIAGRKERHTLLEASLTKAEKRLLADQSLSREERKAAGRIIRVLQTSKAPAVQEALGREAAPAPGSGLCRLGTPRRAGGVGAGGRPLPGPARTSARYR